MSEKRTIEKLQKDVESLEKDLEGIKKQVDIRKEECLKWTDVSFLSDVCHILGWDRGDYHQYERENLMVRSMYQRNEIEIYWKMTKVFDIFYKNETGIFSVLSVNRFIPGEWMGIVDGLRDDLKLVPFQKEINKVTAEIKNLKECYGL